MLLTTALLASSLHVAATEPVAPTIRNPQRNIEANPTPHPKVVKPSATSKVSANPTPHPHPIPYIDVMKVGDRLVVKLRGEDGGYTEVFTSTRAFPNVPGSDGKVASRSLRAKPTAVKPIDKATPLLSLACDGTATAGETSWSFGPRAAFILADGSKISLSNRSKKNRCASVDVMSEGTRVHLSVPSKGKPKVGKVLEDRWTADAKLKNGTVFVQLSDAADNGFDWGTLRRNKKGGYISNGLIGEDGSRARAPGAKESLNLSDVMLTSLLDQTTLRKVVDTGGSAKGIIIINGKNAKIDTGASERGIIIIGNKTAKPVSGERGIIIIGNKTAKPGASGGERGIIIINGMTGVVGPTGIELLPAV